MNVNKWLWQILFLKYCIMKLLPFQKWINLCVFRLKFYPEMAEGCKKKRGVPFWDEEAASASFSVVYVKGKVLCRVKHN